MNADGTGGEVGGKADVRRQNSEQGREATELMGGIARRLAVG